MTPTVSLRRWRIPKCTLPSAPAPSVRAQIGECFGYEPGTDTEGKMVAAIKRLGFDGVYDMNLTADLTIMEEAHEFLGRVKNGGKLPMITSCSPGWIKFCEHYFPEMTENLSTSSRLNRYSARPTRPTMPRRWGLTRRRFSSSPRFPARQRSSRSADPISRRQASRTWTSRSPRASLRV